MVLRRTFEDLKQENRGNIAPFFIFVNDGNRDVKFIGLAVPGSINKKVEECLEVITINKLEGQIKNYRATFTILDVKEINRKWLEDLENGNGLNSEYAPIKWKLWVENGGYNELVNKNIEEEHKYQNLNQTCFEKNLLENIDINELNYLVKNIDEVKFNVINKIIDNKNQYFSEDKTEVEDKKKIIKPGKDKDYIAEYIKKQIIGLIGENIILKIEKDRLINSKQIELVQKANEVEWSSKDQGDGLGYDIKSFDIKDGEIVNKYIEVKTTVGQDKDFEITINEVEKSKYLNINGLYAIARVYNLDINKRTANYYFKEGNLENHYVLEAREYIAHRK